VGIAEPDRELAMRYAKQHEFSMDIVYNSLDEMIAATRPEAVTAFGSIYEHLKVVETCAPQGIHVMVEKPLAVSLDHAKKMQALAVQYKIHLLTNYETTWYATNHKTYEMQQQGLVGELRKIVVHDGHKGPKEIGVNNEFLQWLTDPVLNGGGALIDFGCYGANLITWLTGGQKPVKVLALTQTLKPDVYPKVDDEATILLEYPGMQGIIQASWNWPVARKDMEVYGSKGYIYSDDRATMRYRLSENEKEVSLQLPERKAPYDDPFALFVAVIRNKISLPPFDLSSLENNMLVMEILEAAKKSAASGKAIKLQ
jgi:predicted dehydrogenase